RASRRRLPPPSAARLRRRRTAGARPLPPGRGGARPRWIPARHEALRRRHPRAEVTLLATASLGWNLEVEAADPGRAGTGDRSSARPAESRVDPFVSRRCASLSPTL